MPKGDIVRATVTGKILKADDESDGTGAIRALVSAYDVKYRIGWRLWHTIEAGAFAASIAGARMIPWFWMHAWDALSPQMPVGAGVAEEIDDPDGEGVGLVNDGSLYVGEDPEVARLYRAAKDEAITEWSIGYRVLAERTDADDPDHYYVTEAELLESSLVLRGANPNTDTLKVASGTPSATAPAPGSTRVTTASGLVIETSDLTVLERVLSAAPASSESNPPGDKPDGDTQTASAPDWLELLEHGAPISLFDE